MQHHPKVKCCTSRLSAAIHKRQQDAETRTQRGVVFAQTFNNIRTLLWNNYSRLGKQDKYEDGKD